MFGSAARKPYFEGLSSRSFAANSFVLRASSAEALGSFKIHAPGAVRERIVVAMPNFSWMASSVLGDHSGMNQPDGSPPEVCTAAPTSKLLVASDMQNRRNLTFLIEVRHEVVVDVNPVGDHGEVNFSQSE